MWNPSKKFRLFLCLCVPVVAMSFVSCADISKEFGLDSTPELEQKVRIDRHRIRTRGFGPL